MCNILSFIYDEIIINIKQTNKIKKLITLIHKTNKKHINFTLSNIKKFKTKINNTIKTLNIFLNKIINHNTKI